MNNQIKSGRPTKPDHLKRVRTQISLSPILMAKFKELGASRWLARVIEQEYKK